MSLNTYQGESINVKAYLKDVQVAGQEAGFAVEHCYGNLSFPVLALHKKCISPKASIHLTAGIHGDEPAGSMAILRLLQENAFPDGFDVILFPLLNPEGMQANHRENNQGLDINRDYLKLETPEAKLHTGWLKKDIRRFDVSLNLHEDWEAKGYYLYENNPYGEESVAKEILDAVKPITGIDTSSIIDTCPAKDGIIRVHELRGSELLLEGEWPETFYMMKHYTRHSYTFESPSNMFPLTDRANAHYTAVKQVLHALEYNGHWFDI
jgi:hypothetical protein